MEKRLKRIEILTVILIVITVLNITFQIGKSNSNENLENDEIIESKELPTDLNREIVDKIVFAVKTEYNKENWEAFYDILSDYAKAQINPDNVESEFGKMKVAIGNIGTYAYSHYIYEGEGENADWFEFQYKCRFTNGNGTIKISTRTINNISEVVGINIVLDEL